MLHDPRRERLTILRRWIDALRSDKYKQGRNYLYKDNEFCCLGVLMDIQGFDWSNIDSLEAKGRTATIPEEYNPGLPFQTCGNLAEDNDVGIPFDEIADTIENQIISELEEQNHVV